MNAFAAVFFFLFLFLSFIDTITVGDNAFSIEQNKKNIVNCNQNYGKYNFYSLIETINKNLSQFKCLQSHFFLNI